MYKDHAFKWIMYLLVGLLLFSGYLLFKINALQNPSLAAVAFVQRVPGSINLWAIFLTGLLVGGLTCLAVQGGLLATTIAQREEEKLKEKTQKTGSALPILSFLGAKLIAYTILGFLLGWFGSLFQLSLTAQVLMQAAVAIFMIGTALDLLNVHPIFHYFIIQPPKFLTRLVRKQSKSRELFAPALLGAFTVFIPCGTTQAMMALAIGAGNPFLGAAVLAAFVLGTLPLFFILGYFATRLGDALHQRFMKLAAYALILLALFNLNGAIALTGFHLSLPKVVGSTATNNPTINIESTGYSPTNISVKAGSTINLRLINKTGGGCTQSFTIPSLGIQKIVPLGSSQTITFTAPKEKRGLTFMCSMGMYRGIMNVI